MPGVRRVRGLLRLGQHLAALVSGRAAPRADGRAGRRRRGGEQGPARGLRVRGVWRRPAHAVLRDPGRRVLAPVDLVHKARLGEIRERVRIMSGVVLLGVLLLAGRLFWIQIADNERWLQIAIAE